MAHNLNEKDGKTSFASTEKAWHGLGQIVEKAMTSEEAIKLANLDYDVVKEPIFCEGQNGFQSVVPNNFVTKRTDNNEIFGIVGNRYEIVQNRDAFTFFDAIVGSGQAIFETAGVLGKGERIFISAKMPSYVRIAGTDDVTEMYTMLTSSHDGTGAVIAAITPIRVVCQNTLKMALKDTKNKISIRHTTSAEAKLADAHKLLGIVNTYTEALNASVNQLALKKVSDLQVKNLIAELFPSDAKVETRITNIRDAVSKSYFEGIGQEKVLGTAWGALNGITHYLSHEKEYKDADTKFENLVMDGASSKVADKAIELLMAL